MGEKVVVGKVDVGDDYLGRVGYERGGSWGVNLGWEDTIGKGRAAESLGGDS